MGDRAKSAARQEKEVAQIVRAVAVMRPVCKSSACKPDAKVVAEMKELSPGGPIKIKVSGKGLPPKSLLGFHVHRFGDVRQGCESVCSHFTTDPAQTHGGFLQKGGHAGDLGNLRTDAAGDIQPIVLTTPFLGLSWAFPSRCILGRSLILHEGTDDLGEGKQPDSHLNGHSGKKMLCGVIGLASSSSGTCPAAAPSPAAPPSRLPQMRPSDVVAPFGTGRSISTRPKGY
jgi:superoxide dismutase, Cu-Zn family